MEVKEAKYIVAIAEYKNINKAAKALYISQPSLSKYLHNLEYRMDIKLFNHIQNQYIPTYAGERYLNYARKLIQTDNEWQNELQDIKNNQKGKLNIAAPMVLSTCLIPQTISMFHQKYPDVTVTIYEIANSIEKLLEERTDIDAVIYNVSRPPKNPDYEILGFSEIVMVLPSDHPLIKSAVVKPGFRYPWIDIQLAQNENFILLHDDLTTRKLLNDFFHKNSFTPRIWMQTRNSEVAIKMVLQKGGLTFANENYVKNLNSSSQLTCLSFGSSPMYSTMIAAYRHNQYLSEHLKQYLEILKHFLTSYKN